MPGAVADTHAVVWYLLDMRLTEPEALLEIIPVSHAIASTV